MIILYLFKPSLSDHTPLPIKRRLLTRPQPTLPKKPTCTPHSFEQKISDKVHKYLVTRTQVPTPAMAFCTTIRRSTTTASASVSQLQVKLASALAKRDLDISIRSEPVDNDIIVAGTKHKMQILQKYEDKFGGDTQTSIITKKKGKHSHDTNTITPICMLPSIKKH